MAINRVLISGNLTRNPELRVTQGGTPVLNFSVAVNDRRKNQQTGQWEDRPNFVDCVLFGQRANSLASILHKGFKVALSGRLHQSTWEKDGQRRSRLEVIIDEVDFMTSRGEGQSHREPIPEPRVQPVNQPAFGEDDIPF